MKTEQSAERLSSAVQALATNDSFAEFTSALQELISENSSVSTIAATEGLSRQNIHRILSGDVDPRLQTVAKLLSALGLTLAVQKRAGTMRLPKIGVFGSLDNQSRAALEKEGIFLDASRGEVLVKQGSRPTWFIILLTGEARVYDESRAEAQVLGVLQPGDVIGELSLIDSKHASATVEVSKDAAIWKIKRSKINEYWRIHPEVEAKMKNELLKVLTERLRKTNHKAIAQLNRKPEARLKPIL